MTILEKASALDGILLLNKPQGISSNAALQRAKRIFGVKKAGHSGTLDPLATGMLPICFGEATKMCSYLLESDKCYTTTGRLGIKTNTADSMGQIIAEQPHYSISENEIKDVLKYYQGNIQQIPSMFSALKHNGTPLYKLARQGLNIERKARDIIISRLDLDSYDGTHFSLTICCSKGTYIRNLVEDIGDTLNVGAHVIRLHRVYTSGFQNLPMVTLEQIESMSPIQKRQTLIPMDTAVDYLPSLILSADEVLAIRRGQVISQKMQEGNTTYVRLYDEKSQFIGIGEARFDGDLKAKRLLAYGRS